jgi:hypothetical protein
MSYLKEKMSGDSESCCEIPAVELAPMGGRSHVGLRYFARPVPEIAGHNSLAFS